MIPPSWPFACWGLDSGYVSEMKMKLLPESCSSKCVDNLAAKKWEREFSCNQTWAKIQRKPEQRMWEGVWVSVWAWESSTPLSRPLFKVNLVCAPEESQPQRSGSCCRWCGPGPLALGRPAPGWASWCPPLARCFLNGHMPWKCLARPKFAWKRCPNYFPKDFETQKIFLVFFYKREKC